MPLSPPNWSHSNLSGRSFQGKDLAGANFQGSDVRGCNFRDANLQGANFSQARIGLARRMLLWGWGLAAGTGAIAFHILTQLMFGTLGLTPRDPNFGLQIALISFLATVGALMGLISFRSRHALLVVIAASLEGALLGFWAGGLMSDLTLRPAIYGSVIGSVVFGLGMYLLAARGFGVIVAVLGIAMSNAMFFMAGVNTLQLWFGNKVVISLFWLGLSLLYGWITVRAIGYLYTVLQAMGWTSFSGADINQVRWK